MAAQFGVHPTLIHDWKKKLLAGVAGIFDNGVKTAPSETPQAELFEQIGRLKMELEWVKKKLPPSCDWKRQQVEPGHPQLSVRRQCQLLGLTRSNVYYHPAQAVADDLRLMRRIDERSGRTRLAGVVHEDDGLAGVGS